MSLFHGLLKAFQPLLDFVGSVLAFFYSVIPIYPVDVALLTLAIMALLTPLTVKGTKNMAAMQALGPEMKKLQQKYKGAENRMQLNEEMMRLYKEHEVNPASGCIPMLLQMPAFIILYSVIRGITFVNTIPATSKVVDGLKVLTPLRNVVAPRYLNSNTRMYKDIVAAHGQLNSFGMDFAEKLLSHHSPFLMFIPYLILVGASVGLQYLQMSRLNARNPQAAQANPQMASLQKYMPLIFGFIYLNIAAIINVYFIVSNLIRIVTQEVMFRRGIVPGPATALPAGKPAGTAPNRKSVGASPSERELPKAKGQSKTGAPRPKTGAPRPKTGAPRPDRAGTKRAPSGSGTADSNPTRPAASGSNGKGAKAEPSAGRSAGDEKGPRAPGGASSRGGQNKGPLNPGGGAATANGTGGEVRGKAHPRSKEKRERRAR